MDPYSFALFLLLYIGIDCFAQARKWGKQYQVVKDRNSENAIEWK